MVTFNIRGIMDRWRERQPLLAACLAELDADVVAFQEVLTGAVAAENGGDTTERAAERTPASV